MLFMTKALLFDKTIASQVFGSYFSLIYLTPLIGGFISDRYLGNKRSIIAGGLTMALGELILFFSASIYDTNASLCTLLFFSGLGFMIAGNGFFKPNISSLVGQLYNPDDRRIDPAYTIFYMGINVGAAIGPILCGALGDTGNPADFKWAFLIAGVGMLLSVIIQKIFQDKYLINPEGQQIGNAPEDAQRKFLNPFTINLGLGLLSTLMVVLLYIDAKIFSFLFYLLTGALLLILFVIFSDKGLSIVDKKKIGMIFIVSFFVVFFWSAYEQAGASLTFFADEQTDRHLGWSIPVWTIYAASVAFLFLLFKLYYKAKTYLLENDLLLRNVIYFVLLLMTAGTLYLDYSLMNTFNSFILFEEVPVSFFQSLNSTFVVIFAPMFAWLWIKLGKHEPSSPTKMAWGLLLLALGYLWIGVGVKNIEPGLKVSMIWLAGLYMLHTWGELCLSPIGLSLVNKLAPIKLASLLMAVWFLANSFAGKLAGQLSALYPDNKTTSFLGYQMHNMYDFFMLFVILSGIASLILFLLTKWLQKMMNA